MKLKTNIYAIQTHIFKYHITTVKTDNGYSI